MIVQWLALTVGLVYTTIGLLGLIPPLHIQPPYGSPPLMVENAAGYLLGLLPGNLLLTLLHLATGLWGLVAFRQADRAHFFMRGTALIYGTAAVIGNIEALRLETFFGLLPLFGMNRWLHGITALMALPLVLIPRTSLHSRRCESSLQKRQTILGVRSTLTLAGRPLHPLLVPFPIAALSGMLVTDLAYWWTTLSWYNGSESFWAEASIWLAIVGLASGVVAALAGLVDFVTVQEARTYSAGWIHSIGSGLILVLTVLNLLIRFRDPSAALPWGLVLSTLVATLLLGIIWCGSELVYQHAIGVAEPDDGAASEGPTAETEL